MASTTNGGWVGEQLERWLDEIHLMKTFATTRGKVLPPTLARRIGELGEAQGHIAPAGDDPDAAKTDPGKGDTKKPAETISAVVALALEVHGELVRIVAPATPESLRATFPGREKPMPLKVSVAAAALAILVLFGIRLFPSATFLKTFELLAAAALGASFYSLFTGYRYIIDYTYDPTYDRVYNLRLFLGAVSGYILATFFQDQFKGAPAGATAAGAAATYGPVLLALVGGYSAEAVNKILQRFSETIVTAVSGSGSEQVKAKEAELAAAKTKSIETETKLRADIGRDLEALTSDVSDAPTKKKLEALRERIKGA